MAEGRGGGKAKTADAVSFPSEMKAPHSHLSHCHQIHPQLHAHQFCSVFQNSKTSSLRGQQKKNEENIQRSKWSFCQLPVATHNSNCESDSFHLTCETEPFPLTNNTPRATGHRSKAPPHLLSQHCKLLLHISPYSKTFTLPSASATLQSWSAHTGVEHIENGKQQDWPKHT